MSESDENLDQPVDPLPPAVYKALVERSIELIALLDADGLVMYHSPSPERQFGYRADEMRGQLIFDFVHPDDKTSAIDAFKTLMAERQREPLLIRFRHKSGSWKFVEVLGRIHDNQGQRGMILNIRDVTEAQELLEQARRAEELFRAAYNATGAICCISVLETGKFVDVNDAWVAATGWPREEAIGRTAVELNIWGSQDNRESIISELSGKGIMRQFPATITTKGGDTRKILIDAEILVVENERRIFISATDITDREMMAQQLRQSQRMEAVGQLTGGIAHDFNNMLTVILGQIDLLKSGELSGQGLVDGLDAIKSAATRGADLIQQLMIFASRQTLHPQVIDVSSVLHDMKRLIQGSLGGEIDVEVEAQGGLYGNLDEALLENAILNLALNGRDAMPQGGTLYLGLTEERLEGEAATSIGVSAGRFIKLVVKDSGEGMDERTRAAAFEPFFTTKPVGRGTGLGLSMVFGFVNQSGGHIEIDSAPGEGTSVTLLLPAVASEAPQEIAPRRTANRIKGKTILLVEDNEELGMVLNSLLESMGCRVVQSNGSNLEQVLDGCDTGVDLLLTDVILPGSLRGPGVTEFVRARFPAIPVLYMSGYPRERLTSEEIVEGADLLKKPFSKEALAEELERLLVESL